MRSEPDRSPYAIAEATARALHQRPRSPHRRSLERAIQVFPVDNESYLLHSYRYIELNPGRDRMTTDPRHYPWSSHVSNAFGRDDPLIHPPASPLALAANREQRCAAYRTLAMETLSQDDIDAIRTHLQRQHALGPDRFRRAIEAKLYRRAGHAKIGPKSKPTAPKKSAL